MAPTDVAAPQKGRKQANFTNIEIEQIARSWLAYSNNSLTGATKKLDIFWMKIEQHFAAKILEFKWKFLGAMKNVPRSLRSLGSKWSKINHDCAKFFGAMSTIVFLNEFGTNKDEQMEKAEALYKQTQKKGLDFTYKGAWKILKDSDKWQTVAKLNEVCTERAAKRKSRGINNAGYDAAEDDYLVEGSDKGSQQESGSPEMVSDKPIVNKKAKELSSNKKKANKQKSALAESTFEIVAAAMETVINIQLFTVDLSRLDSKAKQVLLLQREAAEAELIKMLGKNLQPAKKEPRTYPWTGQENVNPQDRHVADDDVSLDAWHECDENQHEYGQRNQESPINLPKEYSLSENEGNFQYQDANCLLSFLEG